MVIINKDLYFPLKMSGRHMAANPGNMTIIGYNSVVLPPNK